MESFDAAAVVEQLGTLVTTWGLRVVGALAVFIIGRSIAKRIRIGVRAVLERREADPALAPFLGGIAYWLALVMVIIAVLGLFGIPTASFVAVIGAAGLAVGLALQGTLSNFAAGVMLLVFRPFKIGNFVETAGVSGSVREIGIFFTRLDTPDNVQVTVPNSEVFGKVIKNYQGNDTRRIDLVMGVGYDDDLSVARRTIADTIDAAEGVLEDPAPVIEVHELGDSSVNFVVRPWVRTEDYWSVRWKLMHDLKVALEGAGCSIPYPQRDVHLFEAGGSAA
ncbi:MAG: mechanosensitive ion channel [Gemmatimonadota bacterium]|nr:mechanosensitive ion channel [Gemmatimonadota bacterium]